MVLQLRNPCYAFVNIATEFDIAFIKYLIAIHPYLILPVSNTRGVNPDTLSHPVHAVFFKMEIPASVRPVELTSAIRSTILEIKIGRHFTARIKRIARRPARRVRCTAAACTAAACQAWNLAALFSGFPIEGISEFYCEVQVILVRRGQWDIFNQAAAAALTEAVS